VKKYVKLLKGKGFKSDLVFSDQQSLGVVHSLFTGPASVLTVG
jgi:hypothetical protein